MGLGLRRAPNPDTIGFVTSINGSRVTLELVSSETSLDARVTVGSFVGIRAGQAHLVGVVATQSAVVVASDPTHGIHATADLDLLGEIVRDRNGIEKFRRGVACYPAIGDTVEPIRADRLRLVYQVSATNTAEIGLLSHEPSMPAYIKVDDLLSKHFAVLGTTGVGKSSGVAVILGEVLRARRDLRVFLLDVHNEYANCFGAQANVINPRSLKLPFWLFNLEEIVDVIYGGRPPIEEEIEILAELIPIAKGKYVQYKDTNDRGLAKRNFTKSSGYTVDTPVPYLLQDLISLIDERMGRLENRVSRMNFHRLITRIETIRNDPRYAFMFENANVGGDMMGELLTHLFRLEPDGRPMTIMQLAGLPVEVVDAVVCVLCRLAFEFGIWSDGAVPLLFVCEESHRYASADRSVGFTPTRRALSRIAKEGRKHGVFLGLVTQRPAELDPTIISQCSTLFAMRMSNDRDQAFLAAAVTDATNLLSFVPLLGTGEVIAFGEGVPLPARMRFRQLPADSLPRSESYGRSLSVTDGAMGSAFVAAVVERWRGASMNKGVSDIDPSQLKLSRDLMPESSSGAALDQAHRRLLRRSIEPAETTEPAREPSRIDPRTANALWQLR